MTLQVFDRWLLITLLAGVAGLVVGCAGCDEDPVEADDAGVVDDAESSDTGDADVAEVICNAGEIIECAGDGGGAGIQVCSDDGTEIVPDECDGTAICEDGECVDVECVPGSSRCVDGENRTETCEPDGAGDYEWVEGETCEGDAQCEQGQCRDGCALAELQDSYIGCEYWALETENHRLYSHTDWQNPEVDPEHRPPFAVVLANTEEDAIAEVTVEGPDGELAESVAERQVRTRIASADDDYVTVHSETVDENGNRIAGPHGGDIEDIELPPGATLTLLLPNQDVPYGETTVSSTAYRIETSEPVVAYQFNPLCCNYNYTNDASMLMPSSALTENYMMTSHAVWAREGGGSLPDPLGPTLSVVGMEDETTVEVQLREPVLSGMDGSVVDLGEECPAPPESLNAQYNLYNDSDDSCMLFPTRDGDGIVGPDDNGRLEVTLDEHEVFNVAAAGGYPTVDLTGAMVEADKPVAAFGAHSCTNVPFTISACDHLESQLFPLETWGMDFVVAPHKIRGGEVGSTSREGTYWKFVARDDNTEIEASRSIDPGDTLPPSGEGVARCGTSQFSDDPESGVFELDRGEYCEFGTRDVFEVSSNQPINIAGFMSSELTVQDEIEEGDHVGDPSMFMVPPRDQFRTDYTFLVPPTYHASFITVIVPSGFNVVLNDEDVDPMDHDYQEVPDGGWLMSHIEVGPGPHEISAAGPFGLIVYGFDDFVSYSFTGGLDLSKDNPLD